MQIYLDVSIGACTGTLISHGATRYGVSRRQKRAADSFTQSWYCLPVAIALHWRTPACDIRCSWNHTCPCLL